MRILSFIETVFTFHTLLPSPRGRGLTQDERTKLNVRRGCGVGDDNESFTKTVKHEGKLCFNIYHVIYY